jgi:putative PIN family toxin of toxin-antitoxin system
MSGDPVSAVVDTNLFVSALISARGTPRALYTAWRDGAFALYLGDPQRAELVAVLARPHFRERFGVSEDETRALLYLLETRAHRAPLRDPLPIGVRDPKDEQILAAALGAGVDYLVSGDADLLTLAGDQRLGGLRIVTARAFLDALDIP